MRINGRRCWLWRAVDQDGYVLDEIVQPRRNTKAARRLLIRLLKKQGMAPKRIITDKLRSYGAAKRQVMPHIEHRSHKGLNNRERILICRFENGSEHGKGFGPSGPYSNFCQSSQRSATSSSQPAQTDQLHQSSFIAARPWPNGMPWLINTPENSDSTLPRLNSDNVTAPEPQLNLDFKTGLPRVSPIAAGELPQSLTAHFG